MDLARYRDAIRRRWPIVVASALLGGVVTGVPAARHDPAYRAETRLGVTFAADGSAEPQPRPSEEEAGRLMQRRVKTYATMMNTPRLTRPVIDALRLPYAPDALAGRIVASSTVDTLIIDVAVTDREPGTAAAVANGLADELQRIARRDLPPAGLGLKAHVAVLRPAVPPRRPEPDHWPLRAAGGVLGGLAIGVGVAFVLAHRRAGTPVGADLRTVRATARRRPGAPAAAGPSTPDRTGPADDPERDDPGPDDPVPDGPDSDDPERDGPGPDDPKPDGPGPDGSAPDGAPAQGDGRASSPAVKERQAS
ncbi:YveK family protein [Micromonospora schwarzwaldensis]|uniref:YveK family protein n=1 Tax=Micromonospora sp. DSM 45708 TaxID=3111767 RepID=UPI0031D1C895